jgi:hypothetical protein
LQGKQTAERLERLLRSAPASAAALVEAASRATGITAMRNLPLPQLLTTLAAMIAAGKLVLLVCKEESGAGQASQPAKEDQEEPTPSKPLSPSPAGDTEPVLTWISIELVDEDGNPLDGEDYEISLSDGSTHKGKTKGPFRKDQIPEGVCSVKFPNLHKNYWRPPGGK